MIRTYLSTDFEWLAQWITNPQILFLFAGTSWNYPLTEAQIVAHQQKYPNKQLYILTDENNLPVAFGEIILKEEHAPRLGRLLVGDPAKRDKGYGKKLIAELINICRASAPGEEICLFVLEHNLSAIRSYEKIGFQFTNTQIPAMLFENDYFIVKKMVLQN
jgi:RimJ/RimL family protein N-acetyltransferase